MKYILLDNFNDTLNIVCEDNGSGETLILNNLKETTIALDEYCQNGTIIPLDIDIIELFTKTKDFIDNILIDEGKENFPNIDKLLEPLNEILNN